MVTNEHLPGLRILKYDRATMKPLADVTFKVYRDTALVGSFTTNQDGEILLTGLEPGTYTVEEAAAPDSHVVNSTPQSIELTAGQADPATLIFFNDLKPGMRLVKVDSVTMKPLPNATYLISRVGGLLLQGVYHGRRGRDRPVQAGAGGLSGQGGQGPGRLSHG